MASETGVKRHAEGPPAEAAAETKKARLEGPERLAALKRQIEYYFSDENLKYDSFFHNKISENPEGWLPLDNILSCKKVKTLEATAEDIFESLQSSDLEVQKEGPPAVRRTAALPTLEPRPPREGKENSRPKGRKGHGSDAGRSDDYHAAGCIIKISNLPEEASWQTVKEELMKRLPEPRPVKLANGKDAVEQPIQFVGTPSPKGACWAFLSPHEDDQKKISEWTPLEINGQEAPVELAKEWSEIKAFVDQMPSGIRRRRENEVLRKKRDLNGRPIMLGGQRFSSVNHLQKCLKEVLNRTSTSQQVNEKTACVLKELLGYHPNGATKLEGYKGFKVDMPANKEWSRCFFVMREDGSTEDFSLVKCFSSLSKSPPFAEDTPKSSVTDSNSKAEEEAQPTPATEAPESTV